MTNSQMTIDLNSMKTAAPPILVTGAHRTGTTWVGKMLAANDQTAYISEPLNVLHRPGVLSTPTRHWYTYICADNQTEYLAGLSQTIAFRYHTLAELVSLRSLKDIGRMGRDWKIFLRGRMQHLRPVIKDPFAVFSAPWFADQLGCQIVITIRHPAGFVSSLKRLAWPFDLKDLLDQPLLMRDHLEPFRSELEEVSKNPDDVIGHNSLLWSLVYQVVKKFQNTHPRFRVIRHEDLSHQPDAGYQALYEELGLTYTPAVREVIIASSSAENPKELAKGSVHSVKLDSQANLNNWKHRLSREEILRIRQLTEEVASVYYPDQDWD